MGNDTEDRRSLESSVDEEASTLQEQSATGLTIWSLPSESQLRRVDSYDGDDHEDGHEDAGTTALPAEPEPAVLHDHSPSDEWPLRSWSPIEYNDTVLSTFAEKPEPKSKRTSTQSKRASALSKRTSMQSTKSSIPPVPSNDETKSPTPDTLDSKDDVEEKTVSSPRDSDARVYFIDHKSKRATWVSLPSETTAVDSRSDTPAEEPPAKPPDSPAIDVQGWRQWALVGSALTGLFLGFLDTTIVSVALPTIASDFDDFSHSTWVVTSYLLTYMGKHLQHCTMI